MGGVGLIYYRLLHSESQAVHKAEHRGERAYAESWWLNAEQKPGSVTAMSMDAPTETQFDVPVQGRKARDAVKAVDGAKKWSSKITGLMVAGVGMLTFVSRDGLGSGPNLSCTVLYLGLLYLIGQGRQPGRSLNILLDNTAADNKNNEMIYFLAWLVAKDYFVESSFFCMMVGHTYSRIDQSFRTLIVKLMAHPIWTISTLLTKIFEHLAPYHCRGVVELHALWNWKDFFKVNAQSICRIFMCYISVFTINLPDLHVIYFCVGACGVLGAYALLMSCGARA